jgi:hypothetical protein
LHKRKSPGTPPGLFAMRVSSAPEQRQQQDDGQGNAQKPKQRAFTETHGFLLWDVCEFNAWRLVRFRMRWRGAFTARAEALGRCDAFS